MFRAAVAFSEWETQTNPHQDSPGAEKHGMDTWTPAFLDKGHGRLQSWPPLCKSPTQAKVIHRLQRWRPSYRASCSCPIVTMCCRSSHPPTGALLLTQGPALDLILITMSEGSLVFSVLWSCLGWIMDRDHNGRWRPRPRHGLVTPCLNPGLPFDSGSVPCCCHRRRCRNQT